MLIVEAVTANSPAEQAGIQVGDRVISYDDTPLPSPDALLALEENTFGQETVTIHYERGGETREVTVPIGQLGLQTRPILPSSLLPDYETGRAAFERSEYAEAAHRWSEASEGVEDAGIAAWLWSRAGASWEKASDWFQAVMAYEAAWERLEKGEDMAARSRTATALGRCHQRRSVWEDAQTCYQQSSEINRRAGLEMWTARSLNNLGTVGAEYGNLQAAQDNFTRALQIKERLAPDSLDVALSVNNLGNVAIQRGDLESARAYLTRALQIRERLAPDSLDVAGSLNNLGTVAIHRGDLQAAREYHIRALQIRELHAPDSLDVAMSLNNLGNVAIQRGELQAALDYYTRALQIKERLAPDSLDVAMSLNNLGSVADDRGELQAALDYYTRALQIKERLAPDSLDVAMSLNNLGVVATARGDLQAAQDYHIRALRIKERLAPGSLDVAISLNNLGNIAGDRGDLQTAQDYYTRALQIFERLAPDSLGVARILNNLGNVSKDHGDLQSARDYHIRALQLRERLAPASLDVAYSLNNLGNVARLAGDLQSAQDHYTCALKIKIHHAPDSLTVASSLDNLGLVAYDRGDLQAALDYHTRALHIYERLAPKCLDSAEALALLGRTLLYQGSLDQALPLLQQAVQILEQQRSVIPVADARALLLSQHTAEFTVLIQGYLAVDQPADAFTTLERSRARSLLELLTERRLDFASDAPADLLQEQQTLDRQRAKTYDQLAKLAATAEHAEHIEALHLQLRDIERQQQELAAHIRAASPHYASLQYPQPLDCKAAQAHLPPGTLLLSFLVDEEQTFLFAVTRSALKPFVLNVGTKALQEQVQKFHRELQASPRQHRNPKDAIDQGKALFDLLLAPVASRIKRAKRLLLCPDGPLHILPWPALVTSYRPGRHPRYLGQQKALHTTLSMTVYAQTREEARAESVKRLALSTGDLAEEANGEERQKKAAADTVTVPSLVTRAVQSARKLLALGDPLYPASLTPAFSRSGGSPPRDTAESQEEPHSSHATSATRSGWEHELDALRTRGLSLGPLPFSRKEVLCIGELFVGQSVVKVGAEATKTAAMTQSSDADVLHFACHGWLDPKAPLSSGLVFSVPEAMDRGAPDGETIEGDGTERGRMEEDNGLLQAWEIFSKLRLRAELVVLSACRTGLGAEVRGEGLIGLTRAFTYAGAKSVLVSLWEVEDESTSLLMQAFYRELGAGKGKAEALQAAIVELSGSGRWRHPYYWSAFLLHGDAG